MKIGIIGPIAYESASLWFGENLQTAGSRFAKFYLSLFEQIKTELVHDTNGMEAEYAAEIGEGGLYRSLWEMCDILEEQTGKTVGCEIRLSDIPMHQEIVEMLELADMDPLEVSSKGCFLVAGDKLPKGATKIGRTTNKKERVIYTGYETKDGSEHKRFLTPWDRQQKDMNDK